MVWALTAWSPCEGRLGGRPGAMKEYVTLVHGAHGLAHGIDLLPHKRRPPATHHPRHCKQPETSRCCHGVLWALPTKSRARICAVPYPDWMQDRSAGLAMGGTGCVTTKLQCRAVCLLGAHGRCMCANPRLGQRSRGRRSGIAAAWIGLGVTIAARDSRKRATGAGSVAWQQTAVPTPPPALYTWSTVAAPPPPAAGRCGP
jgi:hypothetical protein